jgi:hypothetical protein
LSLSVQGSKVGAGWCLREFQSTSRSGFNLTLLGQDLPSFQLMRTCSSLDMYLASGFSLSMISKAFVWLASNSCLSFFAAFWNLRIIPSVLPR